MLSGLPHVSQLSRSLARSPLVMVTAGVPFLVMARKVKKVLQKLLESAMIDPAWGTFFNGGKTLAFAVRVLFVEVHIMKWYNIRIDRRSN